MSENSILNGFEAVFGEKCEIFAKILYIHLSKGKDQKKLDFVEFSKAVLTLDEINFVKRNRLVFDIFDTDKDGKIDIISMLQMIKYLPDKCLLRYEYLLLIDEHKTRSILNASLG